MYYDINFCWASITWDIYDGRLVTLNVAIDHSFSLLAMIFFMKCEGPWNSLVWCMDIIGPPSGCHYCNCAGNKLNYLYTHLQKLTHWMGDTSIYLCAVNWTKFTLWATNRPNCIPRKDIYMYRPVIMVIVALCLTELCGQWSVSTINCTFPELTVHIGFNYLALIVLLSHCINHEIKHRVCLNASFSPVTGQCPRGMHNYAICKIMHTSKVTVCPDKLRDITICQVACFVKIEHWFVFIKHVTPSIL